MYSTSTMSPLYDRICCPNDVSRMYSNTVTSSLGFGARMASHPHHSHRMSSGEQRPVITDSSRNSNHSILLLKYFNNMLLLIFNKSMKNFNRIVSRNLLVDALKTGAHNLCFCMKSITAYIQNFVYKQLRSKKRCMPSTVRMIPCASFCAALLT